MGRWLDAADSVKPVRQAGPCSFQTFLDGLDDDERADWSVILERAAATKKGMGRYTKLQETIVAGGGPDIDPQIISAHLQGKHPQCPTG